MRTDLERRLPQNGKALDLTGREFKLCTVVGLAGYLGRNSAWLCRCKCGALFVARTINIAHRPTGCGCGGGKFQRHGASKLPEYAPWNRMLRYYPGQVCQRWSNFAKFRADVGPLPKGKYVLGRRNRRRPFGPNNAAWMPRGEASAGKGAKLYKHAGRSLPMKVWAKRIGITYERLRQRMAKCRKYGADVAEALSTPAGKPMRCTRSLVGRPKKSSSTPRSK